jgi:excisionase family DNA binding protein
MRQVTGKALAGALGAATEQNVFREDEILTSEEARRLLKIGRTKLWDLTKRSLIPAYRVGEGRTSGLRYKRSELLRWLDQHRI